MSKTFSHTAGSTTVRAVFSDGTEVACDEVVSTDIGGRSLYTLLDADIATETLAAGIYTVRLLDADAPILDLIDFDWDGTNERNRTDLTAQAKADVNAEVDTAIADADLPSATATAIAPTLSAVQNSAGSADAAATNAAIDTAAIKLKTDQLDFTGTAGALKSQSTNPSVTIPVIQVPVPASRTFVLKQTSQGLRGELPIVRTVGESQLMAIDWRTDLPNNGRLVSLDDIQFTGTAGGIVIDAINQGVDRSESKFMVECVIAGTYTITAQVTFDDSDGGGTSIGEVTLIVK